MKLRPFCGGAFFMGAAVLTAIDMKKYNAISMACYVCTGWAILFFVKIAYKALTPKGFLWILAGGVAYTIGAIIYGIGKKRKWFHGVFHVFVVLGSLLQAVGVVFYVVLRI
jgi:hemolysin III